MSHQPIRDIETDFFLIRSASARDIGEICLRMEKGVACIASMGVGRWTEVWRMEFGPIL
jgi:hypothetical protein